MFGWLQRPALWTLVLGSNVVFGAATLAAEETTESWRLFIADHSLPVVRAIDLRSGEEVGRFDVDGYATLSITESGRTVFAVEGERNVVHAISTGISLADHGEHRDLEITAPKLLPTAIHGDRPGHVVSHGDQVAIFYDRVNRFDLLSEEDLLGRGAKPKAFDTQAAHHGVAVPFGSHILVSAADLSAPTKEGELPPRLGLRVLGEDGQQVGEIAPCKGLHGEASSAKLVAFGCEEGVLVARPGGAKGPTLQMLPYGDQLPKGKVSALLGGKAMQFFLGNYGEDKVVLIDPDDRMQPYRLISLPTRRVDFALDPANPHRAFVLTEDGKLHLIDVVKAVIVRSSVVTEPYSKDGHWRDPRPRIAVVGGQSTVTQHIQRLEKALGRRLVSRDTHQVRLTAEGEALLGYARGMLDLNAKALSLFGESRLRGRLRLGVSEDVVANRLTGILEDFIRLHPLIDLELTVALSAVLYQMQDAGDLDLVLAKRHVGETHGRLLFREPLVWLARDPDLVLSRSEALPLIAFPPPSITRRVAQAALDGAGLAWRIVCTCGSLSGLTAAARAGMGVLVQPRSMAPAGLKEIAADKLPLLEDVEFVLVPRRGADAALVEILSESILKSLQKSKSEITSND
eukprot:g7587.t1